MIRRPGIRSRSRRFRRLLIPRRRRRRRIPSRIRRIIGAGPRRRSTLSIDNSIPSRQRCPRSLCPRLDRLGTNTSPPFIMPMRCRTHPTQYSKHPNPSKPNTHLEFCRKVARPLGFWTWRAITLNSRHAKGWRMQRGKYKRRLNGQLQGGKIRRFCTAVGMREGSGWWALAKLLEAHSSTAGQDARQSSRRHHRHAPSITRAARPWVQNRFGGVKPRNLGSQLIRNVGSVWFAKDLL
jgi:hypothetical protein